MDGLTSLRWKCRRPLQVLWQYLEFDPLLLFAPFMWLVSTAELAANAG